MKLKIAKDKILHFIICLAISFIAALITYYLGHSLFDTIVVALFAALFVGMLKELYDVFVKSREWDKYDLLADAAGGVVGAVICRLILLIF